MFVASQTELTTAITDLFLGIQAIVALLLLRSGPLPRPMWTRVWRYVFGLLCLASMLGAIAHGIQMTDYARSALWVPLYLILGLTVAMFAIAAVSHSWNERVAKRLLPFGIGIAFLFFGITQIWSDSFLLFVIYEALMMSFALVLYARSLYLYRWPSAGFLFAGVVVAMLAAAIDTQGSLRLTFIWTFDNHGLFHLVQMLSLLLLTIGVLLGQKTQETSNSGAKG